MAWKKSSPEAIARFDEQVAVEGAERRVLFGCPVWSIAGERYATLYADTIALLLSADDAAEVIAAGGHPFEPLPGKVSRDRVVLPDAIAGDPDQLASWVERAVRRARGA